MMEETSPKRRAWITLAVVLLVLAILFPLFSPRDSSSVVIGCVLPLTGDAGAFGQNTRNGVELALKEFKETGGMNDGEVSVIFEDSRGEAGPAVVAAQKLLDSDGADYLIGDVTSAGTHAIIPIGERNKTPIVSPSASDPSLTGVSSFFFRLWPSDDYEAQVVGQHILDKSYERVAVVYANTDYGVAMSKELESVVGNSAISVQIPVERETLNFRPIVEQIKNSESDSLFLVMYPEDARRVLQQISELQLALPIMATATFEDPTLLELPAAEGVFFASPVPPQDDAKSRRQFIDSYTTEYGEEPGVLADIGYDATMILLKAHVKDGAKGSEAVMEGILKIADYDGASGKLTFDKTGNVKKSYNLKTVRDGEFKWVE